ncbi:MAG: hypothetical protein CR217_18720 [Beijerinckiaceae bacterium]|nr:MAG: hypothetical protein CR217_18720 [Beijerinckiaceae bacterium]
MAADSGIGAYAAPPDLPGRGSYITKALGRRQRRGRDEPPSWADALAGTRVDYTLLRVSVAPSGWTFYHNLAITGLTRWLPGTFSVETHLILHPISTREAACRKLVVAVAA